MSDELKKKGESLIKDLVKDVKDKASMISKVKQISEIAKSLGEDTEAVDNVIGAAEGFSKMVLDRFDKTKPKE